jgi:HEAT repeat protein
MLTTRVLQRLQLSSVLLIAGFFSNSADAAFADMSADGWHTWRVAAAESAPNWCCFVWNGGDLQTENCDLDSRHGNYGSSDDPITGVGEMQLYALMNDGKVSKVRTLSPQCRVSSRATITDLGFVAGDESIEWLERLITPRTKVSAGALAAISVHAGDNPLYVLVDVARDNDSFENRKDAIFWMAQVRGADAESQIEKLMFNDKNPDFREHAAFALSQSDAPGRVVALVRLGNKDSAADVRSKAWFWLAQAGSAESEVEIRKAIRDERNSGVREQAIFALSQLPDERATAALVIVIEDRNLSDEDRKHALFWLAQLDSDPALAYLERILSSK